MSFFFKENTLSHFNTYIFFAIAFFFIVLSLARLIIFPATVLATGSVTVTYPLGGEQFAEGDTVHITWNSDVTQACSIYYLNPNDLNTAYYIGGVNNGTVGTFDWTASLPIGMNTSMNEEIQIVCSGAPGAYSNVFTVNPNLLSPTPTPTPTATITPTPPINCYAEPTYSVSSSDMTLYPGQTGNNSLTITSNEDPNCSPSLYVISYSSPSAWTLSSIPPSISLAGGSTQSIPFDITIPENAEASSAVVQFWVARYVYGLPANVNVTVLEPTLTPTPTPTNTPTPTSTPTPTPALVMSNVSASGVTKNKATIQWTTTPAGTTRVIYGTSSTNLNITTSENTNRVTSHSVNLTALQKSTTYYYKAVSRLTVGGTEYFSSLNSFTTLDR